MQQLLESLVAIVGARNRPEEVDRLLDVLAGRNGSLTDETRLDAARPMFLALAQGLRRSGGQLAIGPNSAGPGATLAAKLVERARTEARNEQTPEPALLGAIQLLAAIDPDGSRSVLLERLAPQQPPAVQVGVLQALAEGRSTNLADIVLPRLRGFAPAVRAAALKALLGRSDWTKALLHAIAVGAGTGLGPGSIDPADRAPLLKHRDPEIARLARAIFGDAPTGSRAAVIAEYAVALRAGGDAARGAKVFERECKSCHRVGTTGFALGPDLTGSPSGDAAALLANILDPNSVVQPNYLQYVVVDQNGRDYSGIIAAETATSLTLRRGDGAEDTILRGQIAEMTSTGLSMMPEGLEKTISKPDMADLIAFLRVSHRGDGEGAESDERSRPLDVGTLPGLIEPEN
jgi:putative heme-binding domain-containing protein